MADLDDFFAKKDKKKSKGKKFTTADEIAKKLEETGKKTEKSKKEKTLQNTTGPDGEENGTIIQEDEWRDFEEEKKDYTGLKIQNITLNEQENDEAENELDEDDEGGMEENEAGEMVPRRKATGPWKVPQMPTQDNPAESEKPAEEEVVRAPLRSGGTVSGGTYIPPNLRNQPPPVAFSSLRNQKSRAAPDVNSEAMFPTLSAATSAEPSGAWGRKKREEVGFEEVRNSKSHSSRYSENSTRMTPNKLALGNKFASLTDQS
ncbi:protein CDV3 homolog [Macrosteles quadrilineatus]|uniref:protein CDV3 homolog n=1 Tax=Macrosteles quadrilineatus TaxID=74068 RepID=UPI0023E34157|nr:protein CDV3 homolog [Macrosteles quadrilineatus]XP_054280897.1 protein CDV3 homolog [Macrosteles quadrilineatus]